MSVNRKAGGAWKETRHDKWYLLAKEQGYRSRAAFKLIQLNKKYNLLSSTKSILDLGAAPGGWLQVCSRYMPVSSLLLGVDLVPIKPMRGVTTIQADITTPECKTLIKKELQGWDVDLVLCDGAPNVAGGTVWSKDAYQQNELVIHALRLATHFMRPNANFVTKVFRSQDYNALLWVLGQLFRYVDVTKPLASRNASAEIFVVCREYLAPKRIDPFLLDPAHIFQQFEGANEHKQPDVFHQKAGKTERSRQGYEDSETQSALIGKQADITVFVDSEQPIVTLGSYGRFTWDSERAHNWRKWSASTTDEVVELSRDLKVLGKGDLKALLKWRKKLKDFEKQLKKEAGMKEEEEKLLATTDAVEQVEKSEEQKAEEEEADMTAAIRELKQREVQRKKTDKKRKRDMKNKLTRRLLLNKNNLSDVQEMIGADVNDELFSLASVQPRVMDVLERKAGEEVEEGEGGASGSDESGSEASEVDGEGGSEDEEGEDEYMSRLEKDLDRMYDAYQQRRKLVENLKDKADAQLKADEAEAMEEEGEEEDDDVESDEELYEAMRERGVGSKNSTTDGDSEVKSNPLLVQLTEKEKVSAAKRMERWFGRDVFGSLDDESKVAEEKEAVQAGSKRKRSLSDMMGGEIATDSSDDSDGNQEDDEDEVGSRWLGEGEEDEDGGEPLTRKQRAEQRAAANAQPKDKPLIGLDALSKTRQQAESEQKTKEKRIKKNAREERRLQRKLNSEQTSGVEEDGDDAHMLVDQDSAKKAKKMAKRLDKLRGVTGEEADGGFETVVAAANEALSSDDEATATTLAIAHRMLDKKNRVDILNNSYNRYTTDLNERRHLPAWFKQEEEVHMHAQLPVTKQEVDEYRQRLMAINAKPIKKIAEARARNRVKAERRWEKIQKKISDMQTTENGGGGTGGGTGGSGGGNEGGSVGERLKRMERLVNKRDKRSIRGDRKYVVTRRGGGGKEVRSKKGVKQSGLTVAVDKRLKKDKRGAKIAAKRGAQKQSTTNKRRRKM